MANELVGFIQKHGDKDMSIWMADISKEDQAKIYKILDKYTNTGGSVANVYDDVMKIIG